MPVKSIAECSHWSILQYFRPPLSYHFPLSLVLSIFKWPLKTGFTVDYIYEREKLIEDTCNLTEELSAFSIVEY